MLSQAFSEQWIFETGKLLEIGIQRNRKSQHTIKREKNQNSVTLIETTYFKQVSFASYHSNIQFGNNVIGIILLEFFEVSRKTPIKRDSWSYETLYKSKNRTLHGWLNLYFDSNAR